MILFRALQKNLYSRRIVINDIEIPDASIRLLYTRKLPSRWKCALGANF